MINNQTNNFSELKFFEGEEILIDKPAGWTSFDVVRKIRNVTKVKKVGHAGTLDPMATGLLIIATGKKTKELDKFQNLNKTYVGTFLLGKTSASMDTETECANHKISKNLSDDLINSVRDEFLGESEQLTPMYSAAKVNGKKLYNLARKGKVIDRQHKKIFIEKFEITSFNLAEISFEICCSKGTYIRVIAHDFGNKLGCGAVLSKLRRTKVGNFEVKDALLINDFIQKVKEREVLSALH